MAGTDWLAGRRTEVAAERILDAAGELFSQSDPASVGMREIAGAAGCSRATLYRYFETREALYTAYVHREAQEVYRKTAADSAGISDPGQRLITGITTAIGQVRKNPALASWFAKTGPPLGADMADQSEVITAMVAASLTESGPTETVAAERRARWVVRVIVSLLLFPGRDADDEQAMIAEFVVPVVTPEPNFMPTTEGA
jgi:AcrR family transcriptional regulator